MSVLNKDYEKTIEGFKNDQKEAFELVKDFLGKIFEKKTEDEEIMEKIARTSKYLVIGGYAGTGKTYLIQKIHEIFNLRFSNCALAGKAAENLNQKGIPCSTMHSLIYKPIEENDIVIGYELKTPEELECDVIMVDEYSMLEEEHVEDLLSFGKPVMFFGDTFQLPPISQIRPRKLATPHIILTEIRRNSGIIVEFLTRMRNFEHIGSFSVYKQENGHSFSILNSNNPLIYENILNMDKVICGKNETKLTINNFIRQKLKIKDIYPQIDEELMCLKNKTIKIEEKGKTRKIELKNGEILKLKKIRKTKMILDEQEVVELMFEKDNKSFWVQASAEIFKDPKFNYKSYKVNPRQNKLLFFFDYCYAITVHKSQGSQYKNVLVLAYDMTWMRDDYVHAVYTAAGRAEEISAVVFQNQNQIDRLLLKKSN